ncbi:MAG: hypothetical protein HOE90_15450, partial [Bacteriovoracaceae bacterium]|nr:hypothetical protein [Bacteriovoracaceae bacterium]
TAEAQASATAEAQSSATAHAQASATAQAQASATAEAQASATAEAQASATAEAQASATAEAQASATADAAATATAAASVAQIIFKQGATTYSSAQTYSFGNFAAGDETDVTFIIEHSAGINDAGEITVTGLAAPYTFKGGAWPGVGGTCGAQPFVLTPAASCTFVMNFTSNPGTNTTYPDTIVIDFDDLGGTSQNQTENRNITGIFQKGWFDATDSSLSARFASESVWTGKQMIVWGGKTGSASSTRQNDGALYDPITDSWTPMTSTDAPTARSQHRVSWGGGKMFVFGGLGTNGTFSAAGQGGLYNPMTDDWDLVDTTDGDEPSGRMGHSLIYDHTNQQFIIFGGTTNTSVLAASNTYFLDPDGDANGDWLKIGTAGAPTQRYYHGSLWTGSAMLVWGGCTNRYSNTNGCDANAEVNDGMVFMPSGVGAGSWNGLDDGADPNKPNARYFPKMSWAPELGSQGKIILWGGSTDSTNTATLLEETTGAVYDLAAAADAKWSPINQTGSPNAGGRNISLNFWDGTYFYIWGGLQSEAAGVADLYRYNPGGNTWSTVGEDVGIAHKRTDQSAGAYTGAGDGRIILFGGRSTSSANNTKATTIYAIDGTPPPMITLQYPNDSAVSVNTGSEIKTGFNKVMNESTLNNFNITLRNSSGQPLAGYISYDAPSKIMTYRPAFPMEPNTTYTYEVSNNVLTGAAENVQGAPNSYTFTTGDVVLHAVGYAMNSATPKIRGRCSPNAINVVAKLDGGAQAMTDSDCSDGTFEINLSGLSVANHEVQITADSNSSGDTADLKIEVQNCAMAAITTAGSFPGGDGTSGDPYQITTVEELDHVRDDMVGEYYRLMNNIDLSCKAFSALGTSASKFQANFDGNGFTIRRLSIDYPTVDNLGFIGYMGNTSSLINTGVVDTYIRGDDQTGVLVGQLYSTTATVIDSYGSGFVQTGASTNVNTGGLVGIFRNGMGSKIYFGGAVEGAVTTGGVAAYPYGANISNAINFGLVAPLKGTFGGVFGKSYNVGHLTKLTNYGVVHGPNTTSDTVGGIIGYSYGYGMISECKNYGSVSGETSVGGIIGKLSTITLVDCVNKGKVYGNYYVGGVAGKLYGSSTLVRSQNHGEVDGTNGTTKDYVGGVAGRAYKTKISDSYSTGNVTGDAYVGGFIGGVPSDGIAVVDSYSSGAVTGNTFTDKFIGGITGTQAHIQSSFFLDTACGNPFTPPATGGCPGANGGLGITDAEMKTEANFTGAGWSFSTTTNAPWEMEGGGQYPSHRFQNKCPKGWEKIEMAPSYAGGDGSGGNPYQITNENQLAKMWENTGSAFKLNNGITISTCRVWSHVGDLAGAFTGQFNGFNQTINGLVENSSGDYAGLFGYADNASVSIKDLTINNAYITGQKHAGAVLGYSNNGDFIDNVTVTGKILGTNNVGSIAGYSRYLKMSSITSNGTVMGAISVGGLIGYQTVSTNISTSSSASNVIAFGSSVGGISGVLYSNSNITNTYATGNVFGGESASSVGGLIGTSYGTPNTITFSHATGSVKGGSNVGGLAGEFKTVGAIISDSYATGNVEGNQKVGGLVGYLYSDAVAKRCYASGNVSSPAAIYATKDDLGGLVGRLESRGSIIDCYSNGSVDGDSYIGGLVGQLGATGGVIINSYTRSAATGNSNVDKFIGGNLGLNSLIVNSFFEDTGCGSPFTPPATGGCAGANGGLGLATADLQTQSDLSGVGWNFTNNATWVMGGSSYPEVVTINTCPTGSSAVAADATFAGGTGTSGDPYLIDSTARLVKMGENLTKYYKLTANVGFSSCQHWIPIGDATTKFTGGFDGNSKIIKGLRTITNGSNYKGLFGYIQSGEIKNLIMEDSIIEGGAFMGTIVGRADSASNIFDNITVTRTTINGTTSLGGVVGYALQAKLKNITVDDYNFINGTTDVGGVAGYLGTNAWIENGSASADIIGTTDVGGVVGQTVGGTIHNFSTTGKISSLGDNGAALGGIVGYANSSTLVAKCSSSATVSGNNYIGGLVGEAKTQTNIIYSYSTGNIYGDTKAGGLIGYLHQDARVVRSFSSSPVSALPGGGSGGDIMGGMVGLIEKRGAIIDSYSNGAVSGDDAVGGFAGTIGINGVLLNRVYTTSVATGNTNIDKFTPYNNSSAESGSAIIDAFYEDAGCGGGAAGCAGPVVGTALTQFYLQDLTTMESYNFGFVGSSGSAWKYPAGSTYAKIDVLDSCPGGITRVAEAATFAGGTGILADPYLIDTPERLAKMSENLSAYYKLTTNMAGAPCKFFTPIGAYAPQFVGELDGNSFGIKNFLFLRDSAADTIDRVGLFGGMVGVNAAIKDMTISDSIVMGKNDIGTFVGDGYIGNASVPGTYTNLKSHSNQAYGGNYVGSAFGLHTGTLDKIETKNPMVFGEYQVGGIIGQFQKAASTLSNSFSKGGLVLAQDKAGGLIGRNYYSVTVDKSYNVTKVMIWSGSSNAEGIIGSQILGAPVVTKSVFFDPNCVTAYSSGGCASTNGGIGLDDTDMKAAATYNATGENWDLATVWDHVGGTDYPFLR